LYAIDRQKILSETILKEPNSDRGRIVTAPFSTESAAYNPLVEPAGHDLALAATLAFAGKKQVEKEIPELKVVCAPDPVARAALQEIVAGWARIGIKARLVADGEVPADGSLPEWDVLYRTLRMTDPFVEMWPLLALDSTPRVESLTHLPDWLRQELVNLETAGDWGSAISQLQQLHLQLASEARVIPLWELDDYMVVRKNIRNVPPRPVHTYQHIETWNIQPWYPTDQ
jgi:ABC-type transport system substrate-binding protein